MKNSLVFLFLLLASCLSAQTPDSLWKRSLKEFDEQNYHGVVADMNRLLLLVPNLSQALNNRGIAELNLGDLNAACSDLEAAKANGSKEIRLATNYLCDKDYVRNLLIKEFYKNRKVYADMGYRPHYTRADSLRGALRPERTCFDVYFYNLYVKIIPQGKRIQGSNDIYFHVVHPTKTIQIDLFSNYTINEISWHGQPLSYRREYNAIFINFPQQLEPGEDETIRIVYEGKPIKAPNPPWDGGFVWKHDDHKNLWVGVACEQLGASSWWPNKDHLSDKADSVQITLDVPHGYQAVSNGNLRKETHPSKKTDRFTWFVSYPINNYNVTFYLGKYVAFSDTLIDGPDTVRLDYNVLYYNLDKARVHFKQTKDVIDFYDKAFGIYPFLRDGFGLVESPYEGMEHQSAIAYGNGYDKNNGTEYRNKFYDYIIVHEAAHEWWGNAVSASDMADIWIHEGFATYAELMFLENRFGKDEYMYELSHKCQYIFNVWPMVQHYNVNEDAFASNDVYNKGAMMLHCLRCNINNDTLFFNMIRKFNLKYRYKTVSSPDFIHWVSNYTGFDYQPFFSKFLYDTEIPELIYSFSQKQDSLVIRYHWTGVKDGFAMPFGIGTDKKESYRIAANTQWQETTLPDTHWFYFYNLNTGYEGCPDHAFTYYRTHCISPE